MYKVTQLSPTQDFLYALGDDGSIWRAALDTAPLAWEKVPPPPSTFNTFNPTTQLSPDV